MVPRSITVLTLLALAAAAHAQVYRWVDPEGNTHYGDRPPATAKDVRKVTVPAPAPAPPAVAPAPAAVTPPAAAPAAWNGETDETAGESSQERTGRPASAGAATGELARRAEERRQLGCERSRERLAEVESARYVYRKDARGNRIVLTDQERDRAVSEARASVRRLCR